MGKRLFIWLPIVILGAIVALWLVVRVWTANPLAGVDVKQLQAVRLRTVGVGAGAVQEIPEPQWARLLAAYRSTDVQWRTAKWQGLAVLTFVLTSGEEVAVTVFDTGRQTGCYQIDGVYYSGGDESVIGQLIGNGQ